MGRLDFALLLLCGVALCAIDVLRPFAPGTSGWRWCALCRARSRCKSFPVIARGVLAGVVLLGTDDSLRSYAPDEIAALQEVVCTARDTHHGLRAYAAAGASQPALPVG
jgi:hypothetical protein